MRILVWMRQGDPFNYFAHCPSLPGCEVAAPSAERAEELMLQMVRNYLYSYDVAPDDELKIEFRWSGGGVLEERALEDNH